LKFAVARSDFERQLSSQEQAKTSLHLIHYFSSKFKSFSVEVSSITSDRCYFSVELRNPSAQSSLKRSRRKHTVRSCRVAYSIVRVHERCVQLT